MRTFAARSLFLGFIGLFFAAPSFAAAGTIVRAPTNQGLVGYWTFDKDDLNYNALDRSGMGNNGVLSGFTSTTTATVPGKMGQALDFDGSNDYVITRSNSVGAEGTGNQTYCAWVRLESKATSDMVVGKDSVGSRAFLLIVNDDGFGTTDPGRWVVAWIGAAGTQFLVGAANGNLVPLRTWTHLCGVRTGPSTIAMYRNGVAQSFTYVDTDVASVTATGPITIGSRQFSGEEDYFDGQIDDVRIYNRALTATEVATLYGATAAQRTKVATREGLAGYWSFEEGSGTQAGDFSGNQNHGALQGGMGDSNWVAGKRGTALQFDGSNDQVAVSSGPRVSTNATVAGWFYWDSTDSEGDNPTVLRDNTCSLGWVLAYTNGSAVLFRAASTDLNTNVTFASIQDRWVHLAFSKAGSSVKYYVNGAQTHSSSVAANTAAALPWHIMESGSCGTGFAKGNADDVRIYGRPLSAEEIKALYNEGAVTRTNVSRTPPNLQTGLVGHWTFDGQDVVNTTAYDKSGQSNNGTLTNGPLPTIGRIGQALNFDGGDDRIEIGDVAAVDSATALSGCAWVKHDSITSDDGIISKYIGGADPFGPIFFRDDVGFLSGRTDTYTITVEDSADVDGARVEGATGQSAANVWTHVCFTYRALSATGLRLYVNGVEDANSPASTATIGSINSGTETLQIGDTTSSARPFDGQIDDVRLYSRTLSAEEVKQLYNLGR